MDSSLVKVSDAKVQSLELKFSFSIEKDKLIIEAFCSNDNQKYVGEIIANPFFNFQDIKELLNEGQFKTLLKNQEILKIKAGAVPIELLPKQKSEIKELKKALTKSLEKQEQMQAIIDFQNAQLNKHENIIKDLKTTVEELKSSPRVSTLMIQEMREQFSQKIKQLEKQLQKSLSNEIKENKTIIDDHESRLKKLVGNRQTKLSSLEDPNQKIKVDQKQVKNKIQKVNPLIIKIEQEEERRRMIESFKWSEQLKSQIIKINGNVVTLTKQQKDYVDEFCLLNASFSKTIKTKQSWAIKINKMIQGISLGVCLKSKMLNYNFNDKNIITRETGHGLYMIGSTRWCFSHSEEEFNAEVKSFEFGSGDVIYIEYDPIKKKLRFSKNKTDKYFQMHIISPPQNDAYHPLVSLSGQNDSIELIQPLKYNLNSQRNNGNNYLFNRQRF